MVEIDEPNRATHAAVFPGVWVRALLPTAVLACLDAGPLHGYAIAQTLGGLGLGVPKGGSLYPALARLEEAGALEAGWVPGPSGPARREYTLTVQGRERLGRERKLLATFAARLNASANGHDGVAHAVAVAPGGTQQEGGDNAR